MTRLIDALSRTSSGVEVLPLSVSYRCATSIIAEARAVVPEIESAPGAAAGVVATCASGELYRAMEDGNVREGAYVLSRTNAPLVPMCLYALQCGIKASIQGKDIGKSLVTLLRRAEHPATHDALLWLRAWVQTECARLDAAGHEQAVEALRDRFECLVALSEGLRTVDEVVGRIDALFADDGGPRLIFSSVHKAKGLEADIVYLFAPTFFHKKGDPREERNLYYVAVTRARRELVIVDGSPRSQKAQVAA